MIYRFYIKGNTLDWFRDYSAKSGLVIHRDQTGERYILITPDNVKVLAEFITWGANVIAEKADDETPKA